MKTEKETQQEYLETLKKYIEVCQERFNAWGKYFKARKIEHKGIK